MPGATAGFALGNRARPFVDIVGYSKLLINEQRELLEHLKAMVRGSEQVRTADAAGKWIRLSTGDGMALVFAPHCLY